MNLSNEELKDILHKVPVDYYQRGVKKNILQRIWHTEKLKVVLSLIESNPKTILDVGCASGWFLHEVKRKFIKTKCVGIDPYEDAIKYGKRTYKDLILVAADAHNIPFPDSSFDLIICTEVLEHVLRPKEVIQEIQRVLKPDGAAIIEMDSGNILFKIIWHWWTHMRRGVWKDAHLHVFDAKKLENIIRDSGLLITKKKFFNLKMAVVFRAEKITS